MFFHQTINHFFFILGSLSTKTSSKLRLSFFKSFFAAKQYGQSIDEYIKIFIIMDYNIYKKLSIEEKNKAFEKWKGDNFIFKSFSKILHKKILELKPEFNNILLISSDLNETIDEISKIKCKNLIYLSQYEIFKKEFLKINHTMLFLLILIIYHLKKKL